MMENAPRDGLDRMISIRSAEGDSYIDRHAGLISPQGEPSGENSRLCRGSGCQSCAAYIHFVLLADNNALSRMVNRTVEVDEKGWTALHNNSQNAAKLSEDSSESVRVRKLGKGSEE